MSNGRSSRRKKLPGVAVLMLALAASSCRTTKTPAAAVQTVQEGRVVKLESNVPQRYSAVILPNLQADLAFKSPGVISGVLQVRGADGRLRDVEPGDRVAGGTQLATVRHTDYQQKVDQGEAGVRQAKAQLVQAKAAFADADLDYQRAKNLYASGSLTKPDFDQAQARYQSTQGQVEAAQAAIDNAHAQLSQANLSLEDTALRAPFNGYVTARNVVKGSLVGSATVGFSLIDTHIVKAEFAIPDTSLKGVRLGQRIAVKLDALTEPVTGTVTAISPQADPKSRVFSVDLSIENANGAIRPGMIGSLSLLGGVTIAEKLVVPISAVIRAPGGGFGVFRVENRDQKYYASAQAVQIGETYGNAIEVKSGVSEGDRIVILGGELLRNGQEIRVLP